MCEKHKIPTRCSIQRGNKIGNCCGINCSGSPGLLESLLESLFLFCFVLFWVFFYVKINKSVILQSLVSVFKGTAGPPVWSTGGRSDVLYISTMDRPPPLLSPPLPLRVALCGSREGIRKSHTRRLRAKPHFSRITIK